MKMTSKIAAIGIWMVTMMIGLHPLAAAAIGLADTETVEDRTQLITTPITYNSVARQYQQKLQIRNRSADTLSSPLFLCLKRKSPENLSLANATDTLEDGSSCVEIPLKNDTLSPGKTSPKFTLLFADPGTADIDYSGRLFAVLPDSANRMPIAQMPPQQKLNVGQSAQLDGSRSIDADGDKLTYQWLLIKKPRKSNAALLNAQTVNASFVPDKPGAYGISLTVNDGKLNSAVAKMVLSTLNAGPVSQLGADKTTPVGQSVLLDQQSFDPDGTTLSYAWSLKGKPNGSKAKLQDAKTATPSLTPDRVGSYQISLLVTDQNKRKSAPATMLINTLNSKPLAVPNAAPTGVIATPIAISGSQSMDDDGDNLAYRWALLSAPAGSTATFTASDQVETTLIPDQNGVYVFQLIVDDGISQSIPVTTATLVGSGSSGNRRPTIDRIPNSQLSAAVNTPYQVTVVATDRDNDPITFSLERAPDGMTIDAASGLIQWTPTAAGSERVIVKASDGNLFDQYAFIIRVR